MKKVSLIEKNEKNESSNDSGCLILKHHLLCDKLWLLLYSIGNTLWLDPLVQRQRLANIQQWTENFNVRTLLLEQNYAVENPEVWCGFIQYFGGSGSSSALNFVPGNSLKVLFCMCRSVGLLVSEDHISILHEMHFLCMMRMEFMVFNKFCLLLCRREGWKVLWCMCIIACLLAYLRKLYV